MKVTRPGFMFMELDYDYNAEHHEKKWRPCWRAYQPNDNAERFFIRNMAVEFDTPDDFNPIPAQVAALEQEKGAALGAYQKTVAQINERLGKLLAITNQVTT